MKTNVLLVVIVAFLFTACAPGIATQATEVATQSPTKIPFTALPATAQPAFTETPTATATPTIVPSQVAPGCLTLLTPSDGVEFPATGRVTFSWSPVNDVVFYALNIMSPSGETVSFETKEPVRALYLEALPAAGTYQWKVIAEDRKRNEICSSALATFSKPSYTPPNQPETSKKKKK